MCYMWSRDCLPLRNTWAHPSFLRGFVVLDLSFSVYIVFCLPLFVLLSYFVRFVLSFFDLLISDYPFGIFWLPLWYLLITPLVSSDYPFGIFWLPLWYLLVTPLVSSDYPFGIFWLPLWYLQTFHNIHLCQHIKSYFYAQVIYLHLFT